MAAPLVTLLLRLVPMGFSDGKKALDAITSGVAGLTQGVGALSGAFGTLTSAMNAPDMAGFLKNVKEAQLAVERLNTDIAAAASNLAALQKSAAKTPADGTKKPDDTKKPPDDTKKPTDTKKPADGTKTPNDTKKPTDTKVKTGDTTKPDEAKKAAGDTKKAADNINDTVSELKKAIEKLIDDSANNYKNWASIFRDLAKSVLKILFSVQTDRLGQLLTGASKKEGGFGSIVRFFFGDSGEKGSTAKSPEQAAGQQKKEEGKSPATETPGDKKPDETKKPADDKKPDDTKKAEDVTKKAEDAKKAADDTKQATDDTTKAADDTKKAADDTKKAADDTKKAADDTKKAADDTTKAADDTKKAADTIKEVRSKLDEAIGKLIDDSANGFMNWASIVRTFAQEVLKSLMKVQTDRLSQLLKSASKEEGTLGSILRFFLGDSGEKGSTAKSPEQATGQQKIAEEGKSAVEATSAVTKGTISDLTGVIGGFLKNSATSIKNWFSAIGGFFKSAFTSLTGLFSGGSSEGGGFFESIFGGGGFLSWITKLFGGGSKPISIFAPNPDSNSMLAHTGRGPGDAPRLFRLVPSSVFDNARRLHGGIGPGEEAAIIRRDESVLTPGQMRALGLMTAGASSGPVVTNYYYISALDTQSLEQALRKSGAVVKLAREDLEGNGALRNAIRRTR